MLINWRQASHVYIVCGKTDLRKGIDGLAIVVAENFGMELYDHSLFLRILSSILLVLIRNICAVIVCFLIIKTNTIITL